MIFFAYLDEFGHIGPFISRNDARYKESPVFGLGGMVLPAERVRAFASWFYQIKRSLLSYEIKRDGVPAYQWEKKGSALYTTTNVLRYRHLRQVTFSLLNRIAKDEGFVFYVGIQKNLPVGEQNPQGLYKAVLREAIKRLDQACNERSANFLMILDEQDGGFRPHIVAEASRQMFGQDRFSMIEPPIQGESHLYQTLQCADWLCGLIGRLGCFRVLPDEYPDLDWTTKYFAARLAHISVRSGIRMGRPALVEDGAGQESPPVPDCT